MQSGPGDAEAGEAQPPASNSTHCMKCLCRGQTHKPPKRMSSVRHHASNQRLLNSGACAEAIRVGHIRQMFVPSVSSPYQPHYEEEVSSQRLVETRRCAAIFANPELGKHLPPDDQLAHTPFSCQRQQAVVLAVQTHVQQVFFRKMVGN